MASTGGIRLLSSLRKTKSKSSLYDTSQNLFPEEDEQRAFTFLISYVEQHNAWPTPATFRQETGLQTVVTNEPLSYYKERSRQKALWEALMPNFKKVKDALADQNPDEAIQLMRESLTLSGEFNNQRNSVITLSNAIGMALEDFDLAKSTIGLRGISTGFQFLDEATDGFQKANLYTDVARSGVGKTFKLLRHAQAARAAGFSVLFLSMEMGIVQIARRFLGMETQINPRFLREGKLSTIVEREMRRQAAQLQESNDAPMYILAGNFEKSVEALKAASYQTEVDLIIADASYLMKASDRTKLTARHEVIGNVMQGIHQLCNSLDRPVNQSVQFNRTAVKAKKGQEEEDRSNPLSHMALEKIAGTDEIGQLSALVEGLCHGDSPHEDDERYAGILKGREGESGWYKYNYKFQPVNFSQISTHLDARRQAPATGTPPDMSYMDA
jgi:replicative DNA helicase